ncbi:MAG: aldehyde dehydrogenase family protein, partial [Pseudomonadota bacterium]
MTNKLWHERAATLKMDGRAFIAGQRVWAKSEQQFDNHSPIDGRNLGPVARCQSEDVDLAVIAARNAFEDGRWAGKAPAARKRVLIKFADLV